MRSRLEGVFGSGYDYAYLYPGMRKVVQAAGRVIRTPEDKGVVYLIDDRFSRPAVRALLPEWWPRSSQPTLPKDSAGRAATAGPLRGPPIGEGNGAPVR